MNYQLPEIYEKRYPKLNILFKEYYSFIKNNGGCENKDTLSANAYINNYYKGIRRDIPYSPFYTSDNEILVSKDNQIIECDNNKTSTYTISELNDYNLPITDKLSYQNIDFLLLVIPMLLKNSSKKDVLKFLFEFYLDEFVEIKEGHEYLGKLDVNYQLNSPNIKFRDDKKYQTFSYIIFHKSNDISTTWVYENIFPLSQTMGIHISLVSVNDQDCIEYFNDVELNCQKIKECNITSNEDEFNSLEYDPCISCC